MKSLLQSGPSAFRLGAIGIVVAAVMVPSINAFGQAKPKAKQPGKTEEKEELPEPENVSLETKDGVAIKATYYASLFKKKAVPIIMLHGWEGNRGDYHVMAGVLQAQGYAVICPDLRGHGQSLKNKATGGEFDLEKLKGPEIEKIVLDVEACKQFLIQKNNAGELNVE